MTAAETAAPAWEPAVVIDADVVERLPRLVYADRHKRHQGAPNETNTLICPHRGG